MISVRSTDGPVLLIRGYLLWGTTYPFIFLYYCTIPRLYVIREIQLQSKSNETPTWCNTVQVLFLQSHSAVSALIRRCDDLPATITHVPVAAVLDLNTPDEGRLRPKHVEWPCRNKTCTVLHQVGVSFDLYYDARKYKIKKWSSHLPPLSNMWFSDWHFAIILYISGNCCDVILHQFHSPLLYTLFSL